MSGFLASFIYLGGTSTCMLRIIAVSGTPGTGKTTIAKEIAVLLKGYYMDVNKVIKDKGLSEGYDAKKMCEIVDTDKLAAEIEKIVLHSSKDWVIDSHLSHYVSPKILDFCIITKCNLKVLQERLEARGYPAEKVRENLDAEIFEICYMDALEAGHKLRLIDTSKGIENIDIAYLISDEWKPESNDGINELLD